VKIHCLIFSLIFVFQSFFSSGNDLSNAEIHAIDVGYGDAVLLRFHSSQVSERDKSPVSGPVILIDGGYEQESRKILDYLDSLNIKNLDIVICTHSHADHSGGLREIIQLLKIGEIWTNGEKIDWLYRLAKHRRIPLIPLKKGIFRLNHDVKIEVLNIWKDGLDPNEGSLAFIFSHGQKRLFFAGDISLKVQKLLLDSEKDLSAEFLKVPHHGWEVLSEFLRAVRPKIAFVSVGPNPYGAPENQSIETLSQLGSKIYRTDRDGTVVIHISEDEK
jgi:competence protein ComEC